jgi:hypothetical protein
LANVLIIRSWPEQSQDVDGLSSHARDSRRRFESLVRKRETLLDIAFLSGFAVLARRRRVETDSAFSVLATLLVIGVAAASESAGSATNRLSDVPLSLLRKPPQSR